MAKRTDLTYQGEILPPERRDGNPQHGFINPQQVPTGGALFPNLYLRMLTNTASCYQSYITKMNSVAEELGRLHDTAVQTKIKVAKYEHSEAIVANEVAKMLHGIEMDAHNRDIEKQKAEAEREAFKLHGRDNIINKQALKAMKLANEMAKYKLQQADKELESDMLSKAQRQNLFQNTKQEISATAERAYAGLYNALTAKRGSPGNFTQKEKESLHKARQDTDEFNRTVDDDLRKDFFGG